MLKIKGNNLLTGKIKVQGSKNSSLALIVASLLIKGNVTLTNVPDIEDVNTLLEILCYLNVDVRFNNNILEIDSSKIIYKTLKIDLIKKIRASSYLMGAFLSIFNKVEMYNPGGCNFSLRPINYHLEAFKNFGASILSNEDDLNIEINEFRNGYYYIPLNSVGTTIDLILFASLSENTIILDNIALESEVIEVINFFKLAGVHFSKIKERTLLIKGKKKLNNNIKYQVMNDRIEAASLALLGASIGDNLEIEGFQMKDNLYLLNVFLKCNVPYKILNDTLYISKANEFEGLDLITSPYPLFPTDIQPLMCVFLSLGNKKSTIKENIYPSRLSHVNELNKLGFNLSINDNKIIINKFDVLKGNNVKGNDLRGSFSLLMASLLIDDVSYLEGYNHILRGYENIINRLRNIGADILKINE